MNVDFERLGDTGVLITGGADGIGLALARILRQAGARVFLADVAAGKLAARAARSSTGSSR
jgi:NAD(P)-dependent dehydrogenase (short-subunit alcohol dehydrogenase family)